MDAYFFKLAKILLRAHRNSCPIAFLSRLNMRAACFASGYFYSRSSSKSIMPHEPVHPFTVRHLQSRWGLTGAGNGSPKPRSWKRRGFSHTCSDPIDCIREMPGHNNLSTTLGYIYNPLTESETYHLITKAL